MPKINLYWKEARSASIQFGGNYIITSREGLENALVRLSSAGQEDTFDIRALEVDPATNMVMRTLANQEHGFPETLFEDLRAIFKE